jgi:hypothetical protein
LKESDTEINEEEGVDDAVIVQSSSANMQKKVQKTGEVNESFNTQE